MVSRKFLPLFSAGFQAEDARPDVVPEADHTKPARQGAYLLIGRRKSNGLGDVTPGAGDLTFLKVRLGKVVQGEGILRP